LTGEDASLLLSQLWKVPRLTRLDLDFNKIQSFEVFAESHLTTSQNAASRLRVLHLTYNDCMYDLRNDHVSVRALLNLLQAFPELADFGGGHVIEPANRKAFPPFLVMQLDMNLFTGRLLAARRRETPAALSGQRRHRNGDPVQDRARQWRELPLCIWPLVLGRLSSDYRIQYSIPRQATVIYNILQDPAFVEREVGHGD